MIWKLKERLKSGSQFLVWNQIQKKCENTVYARLCHPGCECRTATENRASLYHWRDGQQNTVIRMKAKCQTSCFSFTNTCASQVCLLSTCKVLFWRLLLTCLRTWYRNRASSCVNQLSGAPCHAFPVFYPGRGVQASPPSLTGRWFNTLVLALSIPRADMYHLAGIAAPRESEHSGH